MFDDKKTLAQLSTQILCAIIANPNLVTSDNIVWDALCEDAHEAACRLYERAGER